MSINFESINRAFFVLGVLLMFITTALELRAWWQARQVEGRQESMRHGLVGVLNILALMLVIGGR